MRIPDSLASLADYGIIEEVLRPLMSGKEAQIYLVRSGGEYRVAKVYKEAQNRTFRNRAEYTEGRKVRNTRDQRAMGKSSRHGRAQAEAAWRTTEVDMIYRLRDAGVRVPTPYHFIDGVLVMEMIRDERGDPAPRLGDVALELEDAQAVFGRLLAEVVRMLAAGVVHGDLSDFNVLMGPDGPVVIDFPQAVDASTNRNARKLLLRDVDNLHRFVARFAPEHRALPYAQEMWALYERGELTPDTKLTGRYQAREHRVSTEAVLGLIGDAARDERRQRERLGLSMRGVPDLMPRDRAARELESPPRPPSRYAQKREAQVAARRAEALTSAGAQRSTQGHTSAGAQRGTQGHEPRARTASHAHGKAAHQQASKRTLSHAHSNAGKAQPDAVRRAPSQDRAPSSQTGARERLVHPQAGPSQSQHSGAGDGVGPAGERRRRRRRRRKPSADPQKARTR